MSSKPFPPPNGMTSFWRSSPGSLDNHRSTAGLPSKCDILIIGAGFSGASLVTHMLSQPESKDKSIVVLEARQLCSGATGRNGGHIKPDVYNLCSHMALKHGIDAGAEIAEFELANFEAVKSYVLDNNVDCDFMITQAVDVQLSEEHNALLKGGYGKLVNAGVSATKQAFYVDDKYAETVSGLKGAKGAFKYTTGHLWPSKLVHYMFAEALKHQNLNLQTNTPVTAIPASPDADGSWSVTTSRGVIKARKVIVATNAYTAALLPEYHERIIPYRAICSRIVAPNPPLLADSYVIRFSPADFDYLIPRPDGSIIVGGARSAYFRHTEDWYGSVDDSKVIERAKDYFEGYMQRHFRGWENSGAHTDQIWTGIMGYSADEVPRIGHVPGRKNMFIMGGFTGHGMPQVFLAAKGISRMVLENMSFSEAGIPKLFEETEARLKSDENFLKDMIDAQPSLAKM
ncbi:gamma-glutamylputrescine oxidoreductase [Fusarium subglutinans]|uniref:Gamma-glutamylputrescine oxidoreductase n=1 Tax=Gibberella subglutinans TaxID=42677 RepID=A0A8H5PWM8_GIBSU|nr:gamma-glutamylputrescine oxidoreductase [Fusarium subglutinans]KAF5603832.1 gamma-glutamylputrescine oxidoreductase [Fusarium subglutinans]